MSNSYVSSPIRSSGLSKAGVVKRGYFTFSFSVNKPLSISIILDRLSNEIVKCFRYQSRGFAYIVEPSVS